MKIEHEALGWCTLVHEDTARRVWIPDDVPHSCSVPNCPGDLNRRKLEMFGEMLGALKEAHCTIKVFHGKAAWDIYDSASPEMVRINGTIARAKALK